MKHIILSCLIVFGSFNLGFGQKGTCKRFEFDTDFHAKRGKHFMKPNKWEDPTADWDFGPKNKKVFIAVKTELVPKNSGIKGWGNNQGFKGKFDNKFTFEPIYRVLTFRASFNGGKIEKVLGELKPNERDGYNKLMRILSTGCDGHDNYLTLGWRWNKDANNIEYTLYSHINHHQDRSFPFLQPKEPNPAWTCYVENSPSGREWVEEPLASQNFDGFGQHLELVFTSMGYYVRVGDKGYAIRREIEGLNKREPTGMEYYGHIGGAWAARATFDDVISIKEGYMDPAATWWTLTAYKGYDRSRFYNGEYHTIYASKEIRASLQTDPLLEPVKTSDNPEEVSVKTVKPSFFEVEPGATVNLVTSTEGRIKLNMGFHAKSGSTMHMYIGTATNTQEAVPFRCTDGASFRKAKPKPSNTTELIPIETSNNIEAVQKADSVVLVEKNNSTVPNNTPKTVATNNTEANNNVLPTIVPNPNTGIFAIQGLANKKIQLLNVYNTTGNKIRSLNNIAVSNLFEIDLQNQPTGLYLITILVNGQFHSLKTLIEK